MACNRIALFTVLVIFTVAVNIQAAPVVNPNSNNITIWQAQQGLINSIQNQLNVLNAALAPVITQINILKYGADSTGTLDSTNAIQAAINTCTAGQVVIIPNGSFTVAGHLTNNTSCAIRGFGWSDNATYTYGSANWTNGTITGSILHCTATSGTCLANLPGSNQPVMLSDFGMVGAGTGTENCAIVGDTTHTPTHNDLHNLMFGNCPTGLDYEGANSTLYNLTFQGDSVGLNISQAAAVDNNWVGLQGNGVTDLALSNGQNSFIGAELEGSFNFSGSTATFINFTGVGGANLISGGNIYFVGPGPVPSYTPSGSPNIYTMDNLDGSNVQHIGGNNIPSIQTDSVVIGGPQTSPSSTCPSVGANYDIVGGCSIFSPAPIAGTSAGTYQWGEPGISSFKKVFDVYLNGYENTTGVAQTITFPKAFGTIVSGVATVAGSGSPCAGITVNLTTMTLATSMGATVTGLCEVTGF